MKSFIVLSVVLAVASATYPYAHLYGQHIPVIDHKGVPVDTPDVQAAKAVHFAAHAAVNSGLHGIVHAAAVPYSYAHGLYHYPIIDAAGRPVDTPEVQHAKAAHFAAYHEAAARNGVAHLRKRRGIAYPYAQHIPVIGHNGVPVDTPEVQAAKAEHFAAHAKVAVSAPVLSAAHVVPYAAVHAQYPIHIPVITPHGVPVDTPEVQHSKAAHFAAHAEANARNAAVGYHGLALHHY